MDDFIRRCAKVLSWKVDGNDNIHLPKDLPLDCFYPDDKCIFHISQTHFHDSYDWAMLLVKKMSHNQQMEFQEKLMAAFICAFDASPKEWCEFALEILEKK